MAYLTVIKGDNLGEKLKLQQRTTIGRAENNTIQLKDLRASKVHAEIVFKSGNYVIFDLNSNNGIIINNKLIRSHKVLQNNDEFSIADTIFRFVNEADPLKDTENKIDHTINVRDYSPIDVKMQTAMVRNFDGQQYLEILTKINNLIASPPSQIDTTFKQFLKIALDVTNGANGCILLYDKSTQSFDVYVSIPEGDTPPIPPSLFKKITEEKQEVITSDVINDFRFPVEERESFTGIRSLICVPITYDNQIQGALYLSHPLKNQFDYKEITPIKAINNALGLMIENSHKDSLLSRQIHVHNQEIMGSSKEIKIVVSLIDKVAKTPSTRVLIKGEIGTGKGLFAREIHNRSPRRIKPFSEINCGMYDSSEDFEIELYGCERGFHPKSKDTYIGKIEQANGGTLFLNQIEKVPLESQKRLLNFLQTKIINRNGSEKPIKIDIQILASTNENLEKAVDEKRFRWDLFFQLNVFQINIPPLRERISDIPALVQYFIKVYSTEMDKKIIGISDEALRLLTKYNWLGNVRELENCIENAVLHNKGTIILPEHLMLDILEVKSKSIEESTISYKEEKLKSDLSLEEAEKDVIFKALEKHEWDVIKASLILGIHRNTLRKKIVKYELTPSKRIHREKTQ